jgi:hypothetical protein
MKNKITIKSLNFLTSVIKDDDWSTYLFPKLRESVVGPEHSHVESVAEVVGAVQLQAVVLPSRSKTFS